MIGRYRIDGMLGRGGMGVVYAGWDPMLERKVAIKVLRDTRYDVGRARLLREARAMAKLNHPNVITVFEVGSADDGDFIAMELVEGMNLAEWLRTPRERSEILRVFLEAGRGLAAAHAAGLIHRDFKPGNVLVRADGCALVTDFGLVRSGSNESSPHAPPSGQVFACGSSDGLRPGDTLEVPMPSAVDASLTETGALLGTPQYMAPEQFQGNSDARSDQFAFCIALWEALAGEPPFAGDTFASRCQSIEHGVPSPAGATLERGLRATLARGLAVAPDARWPSIDALLHALAPRRRRVWRIGATVAACLVIGGLASAFAFVRGAPPEHGSASGPVDMFAGADVRRLMLDGDCNEYPAWSPDGKTLVYDRAVGRASTIEAFDVDSGRTRRLTSGVADIKSAVSPDGRNVAFVRLDPESRGTYVVPLAGGTPRRIGAGGLLPVWADAGSVWLGRGPKLQLVAVATGQVLRTLDSPAGTIPHEAVVLPDGRLAALMFPAQPDLPAAGIAIFARDGSTSWLSQSQFVAALALAPEGDAVFASHLTQSGTRELWRVPLDGRPPAVVAGPAQPTFGLSISGAQVAWSDCSERSSLGLLSADLKTRRPLGTSSLVEHHPAAIPGSREAVIVSSRDSQVRLWVIDVDRKRAPRELPGTDGAPVGPPAVSQDGQQVYTIDASGQLLVQRLDGSAPPHVLATHVSGTPAVRRDGSIVAELDGPDGSQLAMLPAGGGTPVPLVAHASDPVASPVADDLYFVLHQDDADVVMHRDASGATRPVSTELPRERWMMLAVSPDGKRLALAAATSLFVVDARTGRIVERHRADDVTDITGLAWIGGNLLVSDIKIEGDLWLAITPRK
jgi:predicted Ser/Thr protein kinase